MRPVTRRTLLGSAATASLAMPFIRPARSAAPIQLISHRFPAIEYIAEKIRTAIPGVEVNTQLMPFDKALELATIAFSSQVQHPRHRLRQRQHVPELCQERLDPPAGRSVGEAQGRIRPRRLHPDRAEGAQLSGPSMGRPLHQQRDAVLLPQGPVRQGRQAAAARPSPSIGTWRSRSIRRCAPAPSVASARSMPR